MKNKSLLLALLLAGFSGQALASSSIDYESVFKCDGSEKFAWYCDQAELKKKDPKKFQEAQAERERKVKAFDIMAKDLEDTRKIAIMEPTSENLKEYISKQLEAQNRAAMFTDVWKRVQWSNPELDYSTRFGTSSIARQETDALKQQAKESNLKELASKGWGAFFFYRSDCSFCHRMTPSINMLEKKGLPVLPISVDGKFIPELTAKSEIDKGQSALFKVQQVPTVVLVNTKTKEVIPVASGAATYSDIEHRIYTITKTKPGENY